MLHYTDVDHTSHLKVTIKRPKKEDLQNIVREFQVGEGAAQLRILSSKLCLHHIVTYFLELLLHNLL